MLLLAWKIKGQPVLVVGGGNVARGRIDSLLRNGANVTVVAPEIDSEITAYKDEGKAIEIIQRKYEPSDLESQRWAMVLTAIDDRQVSRAICYACRDKRIPVNVADMPDECDFYFGSMVERGPLQVMVSTNGKSPRLAHKIRKQLEQDIDELGVEKAIENISKLRDMVRQKTTGEGDEGYNKDSIKTRMGWISDICDRMTFNEMAALTDDDIAALLARYPN